jgi:DNA-binding Lrp family transcriptional regulator
VLIQTESGKTGRVAEQVAAIPGVSSAAVVTGPYDVIAGIEADTIDSLGRMVVSRIQAVEGITRTMTCPVVHI